MKRDTRQAHKTLLFVILALLFVAAGVFHVRQNSAAGVGGAIAPVKTLWLLVVIVFWFALPLVWSLDKSLDRAARQACTLLLFNMVARGIVELWMMYVGDNWRHSYGISHDIFSAALCIGLAFFADRSARWVAVFFVYCTVLFLLETCFAVYLRDISHADGAVFFLPESKEHRAILRVTGGAVTLSAAVIIYLIWKWLYAAASRSSFQR